MMQKIRKAMARINEKQQVSGEIEMDDAFFTTIENPKDHSDNLIRETSKTSRRITKQKAFVMVESMMPAAGTHKGKYGKIRMLRTEVIDTDTVWRMQHQKPGKSPKTKTTGYRKVRILEPHRYEPSVVSTNKSYKILPWVHTAIENVKRLINGIYHHVSSKFAQLYFDEFCFKFNYRFHKVKWGVVFEHALTFNW
ncbi:MAG: transposase [Bacteroidetes bacterium]|nr:transposase [Bacteroidota bacterium]